MKYLYSLPILFVLHASSSSAALAPYWERAREIKAIISNNDVEQIITDRQYQSDASGVIDSVAYMGSRGRAGQEFQVTSGNCVLPVTLHFQPNPGGVIGPAPIQVIPGEMECGAVMPIPPIEEPGGPSLK